MYVFTYQLDIIMHIFPITLPETKQNINISVYHATHNKADTFLE